ncbi:MAG: hypothetical protein GY953_55510 [bacterium]|nr:hypothetical protein [bacterium]
MQAEVSLLNFLHSITEDQKLMSDDAAEVLEGLRRGDVTAELQFAQIYAEGLRFYLRRNVGTADLDGRVRQLLQRLQDRVLAGWNMQPGELAAFLAEETREWRIDGQRGQPSHTRVQLRAETLKIALKGCSAREIEMLIRYYVNGESLKVVTDAMDASEEELLLLKWRLRRVASRETGKKPVSIAASVGSL